MVTGYSNSQANKALVCEQSPLFSIDPARLLYSKVSISCDRIFFHNEEGNLLPDKNIL